MAIATAIAAVGVTAPATASADDTQDPWVKVTWPSASSTVSGTTTLTATATDDVGVDQVKWYVDGREVGWDGTASWAARWNSASVSPGWHRVIAKAADAAGNWGTSAELWFETVTSISDPDPDPAPATSEWQLVSQDDFNGDYLDTSKWYRYGPSVPGHAGNGLRDYRALSVDNGLLTITARMIDGVLVSGGISHRLDQTYGRYEFRIRTDPDPSAATSGVVLTWPQSQNWPIDGENNIYETTLEPDRIPVKSFIHYGWDNQQYWFHHTGVDGTQWHTFAMEWEREAIRIYRDGALVWTVSDQHAIPDVAHHLSIQLDAFKEWMSGTVRMQVDWVRVYKKV